MLEFERTPRVGLLTDAQETAGWDRLETRSDLKAFVKERLARKAMQGIVLDDAELDELTQGDFDLAA